MRKKINLCLRSLTPIKFGKNLLPNYLGRIVIYNQFDRGFRTLTGAPAESISVQSKDDEKNNQSKLEEAYEQGSHCIAFEKSYGKVL